MTHQHDFDAFEPKKVPSVTRSNFGCYAIVISVPMQHTDGIYAHRLACGHVIIAKVRTRPSIPMRCPQCEENYAFGIEKDFDWGKL